MKLLVIAGSQLRHQYFLATLAEHFDVAGVVDFRRTLVQPPKLARDHFLPQDLQTERVHLERLAGAEQRYFAERVSAFDKSNLQLFPVANDAELNSEATRRWVRELDADVLIDYGSGIIKRRLLDLLPEWRINLHGGLSPYFRGSATLLWPFYLQQPELAGATFHLLERRIDGGDILQHVRPTMHAKDHVTDIMCRCIVEASEVGVKLLAKLRDTGELERFKQKGSGKLFLERDYKPSCIEVVNELMKRGMIGNYLARKEATDAPYRFVDQLG